MSNNLDKNYFMANVPQNVISAHEFEKSNRAHPSVSRDAFYHVPKHTENAPPGTLLKLEKQTDTSLYTLPLNTFLSRLMYQSQSSKGFPVPVSAYLL